jgi:hypothetical protein
VLHVASVLILAAYTFFAFAAAADTRKRVLMITGIATLLVLLTGIRMWQGMYSFTNLGWIWVKIVCWVGLSALSGLAYRKRNLTNMLMVVGLLLAVVALVMVYYRPF